MKENSNCKCCWCSGCDIFYWYEWAGWVIGSIPQKGKIYFWFSSSHQHCLLSVPSSFQVLRLQTIFLQLPHTILEVGYNFHHQEHDFGHLPATLCVMWLKFTNWFAFSCCWLRYPTLVADVLCQPTGLVSQKQSFMVDIITLGITRIGSDWLHTCYRIRRNQPCWLVRSLTWYVRVRDWNWFLFILFILNFYLCLNLIIFL